MGDIDNIVASTKLSTSKPKGRLNEDTSSAPSENTSNAGGEKNRTDPKVCHDPSLTVESIVKVFYNQNKNPIEEGEVSAYNEFDTTKLDGIEYPLITVNNRNVEKIDINYMDIQYKSFLPRIELQIHDDHQSEQKINTTQMSSIIRVCMLSTVDKVYRKILLNFRTYDVKIDELRPTIVTYYGEMYIPEFRQINTKHIWMENICPCQPNCGQGGHINANTWEMLHKIAQLSGLGFAATKKCKEIPDRVIRNIYSQRFNQYIEEQLLHCGTDEENIFDAWVDLYGYIVMVNVPWVMSEDIKPSDLQIAASVNIHTTSNDIIDQRPEMVDRTLTNYNLTGTPSNMEIANFNMDIDNDSIRHGTLEKVYTVNFKSNLCVLENTDIQSKQDSVDGDFIEDYNTGKNRPIPKYYFNDDAWTGLSGGYDLHKQKVIRNAYFRKKRQSVFNVILKHLNLGLQRGTLVNIAIFDNDIDNKRHTMESVNNLGGPSDSAEDSGYTLPPEMNKDDVSLDGGVYLPNMKLSGLYYIDGMSFTYEQTEGRIVQTLYLLKKGTTSGYENRHTSPRLIGVPKATTLPQDAPYKIEN